MGEAKDNDYEEELVDFEDDDPRAPDSAVARPPVDSAKKLVSLSLPFCHIQLYLFSYGCLENHGMGQHI